MQYKYISVRDTDDPFEALLCTLRCSALFVPFILPKESYMRWTSRLLDSLGAFVGIDEFWQDMW